MELSEVVLERIKAVWQKPTEPIFQGRVRPASRVGIVIARWKCQLGLALFADGLGHLSILNPARQVGESALSILAEKMATTPNGTLIIGPVERGPRIYPREALFLVALTAFIVVGIFWTLYTCGLVPWGIDDLIRLHVVDRLLHRHETRTLTG